jgi:hypothetical protein
MLNSLIGIIASSGGVTVSNSYESISTTTVGSGGVSSITFSSIPSTYQHLQIRAIAQASGGSSGLQDLSINFNSDTTGSNYYNHRLWGNGASASATGFAGGGGYYLYQGVVANTSSTNIFAGLVIDVLDYANTNKNKTVRSLSGTDLNGSGQVGLQSGLWINTGAVTSITVSIPSGSNINQYSQFALYGIKG